MLSGPIKSDLHEVDLNAGIQSTVNIILGQLIPSDEDKRLKVPYTFFREQVIAGKTASLIRTSARLGAMAADADDDVRAIIVTGAGRGVRKCTISARSSARRASSILPTRILY